jgi:hypothetical protein
MGQASDEMLVVPETMLILHHIKSIIDTIPWPGTVVKLFAGQQIDMVPIFLGSANKVNPFIKPGNTEDI